VSGISTDIWSKYQRKRDGKTVSITEQSILSSLGHCPNLSQSSPLFRDFLPHEYLTPPAHIPQEQVCGNKSSRHGWYHRMAIMTDCFLHRISPGIQYNCQDKCSRGQIVSQKVPKSEPLPSVQTKIFDNTTIFILETSLPSDLIFIPYIKHMRLCHEIK
jgi:hypothetical protein